MHRFPIRYLIPVLVALAGCSQQSASSRIDDQNWAPRRPPPMRAPLHDYSNRLRPPPSLAGVIRPPVRSETACLTSGDVQTSRHIRMASGLGGPVFGLLRLTSSCGAQRPFHVRALDYGRVKLAPAAILQCGMIPAVEQWLQRVVVPAAQHTLGSTVTGIRVAASYSCRRINGKIYNKMSQHAYANALDISAFTLADGRVVTVKRGWHGRPSERRFLRTIHRGACRIFSTVLGPEADRYHQDHFHFDLARHNRRGTYHVCR